MGSLLGSIFDFLGGTVIAALEEFLVWLYQLVVIVFQVLYQLLGFVAQFFITIFKTVATFLDRLWNGFFKAIFTKVYDAIKAASTWLEAKLAPVIKFLKRVRDYYLKYFNTYIRPILLLIQHVRQYLQILTFLHIGIAQKLDAYLAQVQAKITQAFAQLVGTINTAIDILNAIVDPLTLLKKPTLLLSIRRQIPALIHVLTGRPPGYFFGSPRGAAGGAFATTASPFNFKDPSQNPPTSSYLEIDDGIGDVSGFLQGFEFESTVVDQLAVLDVFNNDLYPLPACTDPVQCLATAFNKALTQNNG